MKFHLEEFWGSEFADRVKHPAPLRRLLNTLQLEDPNYYTLTFYGSFAKKIFDVMRREGKDAQGFDRMQQSFTEAVQKVRSALEDLAEKGFVDGPRYTELSQQGMQALIGLIEDLSVVKDWEVSLKG